MEVKICNFLSTLFRNKDFISQESQILADAELPALMKWLLSRWGLFFSLNFIERLKFNVQKFKKLYFGFIVFKEVSFVQKMM